MISNQMKIDYSVTIIDNQPIVYVESGVAKDTWFSFELVDGDQGLDLKYKVLYTTCTDESSLDHQIKQLVEQIITEVTPDAVSYSSPESYLEY